MINFTSIIVLQGATDLKILTLSRLALTHPMGVLKAESFL